MTPAKEPNLSHGSRTRIVAIAIVALLVGTALGPSVANAASSAWVRVKNWPVLQKVRIMNTASQPVYTQPPAHTVVNLHGGAQILNSASTAWVPYYTVPADKWLVITKMNTEGSGPSPIGFVALVSSGNIHETFPISLTTESGQYHLSSTVGGTAYVPPGTALYMSLYRESAGTGVWNVGVWVDGYLTDRP